MVDLAHGKMRSGVPEGVGVLPSEQTHVSEIEHEIGCLSPIQSGLPSGVDRIPNRVRSEWHPNPEIRCQWRRSLTGERSTRPDYGILTSPRLRFVALSSWPMPPSHVL